MSTQLKALFFLHYLLLMIVIVLLTMRILELDTALSKLEESQTDLPNCGLTESGSIFCPTK